VNEKVLNKLYVTSSALRNFFLLIGALMFATLAYIRKRIFDLGQGNDFFIFFVEWPDFSRWRKGGQDATSTGSKEVNVSFSYWKKLVNLTFIFKKT
jgi:hypothetical protein